MVSIFGQQKWQQINCITTRMSRGKKQKRRNSDKHNQSSNGASEKRKTNLVRSSDNNQNDNHVLVFSIKEW